MSINLMVCFDEPLSEFSTFGFFTLRARVWIGENGGKGSEVNWKEAFSPIQTHALRVKNPNLLNLESGLL